jgi:hypothetical protein
MTVSYVFGKAQMKYERQFLRSPIRRAAFAAALQRGSEVRWPELRTDVPAMAELFIQSRKINYRKETITTIIKTITTMATLVFNLVFYVIMVKKGSAAADNLSPLIRPSERLQAA